MPAKISTRSWLPKQLAASTGDAEEAWKAEVWDKMLVRIRKMESMMNSSDHPKALARRALQLGIRSTTLITRPTAITGGETQRSITSRKRCSQIGCRMAADPP